MRREFSHAVRVEIIKRAEARLAYPACENCGVPTQLRFQIDHRDPDAMQIDKSRKLTAADGWLLCIPCHAAKTAKDVADIAKAKRREAAHLGARRPKQRMQKYKCINGHDRCAQMLPGPDCPYCEKYGPKLRGPRRTHEDRIPLPPRKLCEDV